MDCWDSRFSIKVIQWTQTHTHTVWSLGHSRDAGKWESNLSAYIYHDHWFNGHELGWGTGKPGMQQSMGLQRVKHHLATEQTNNYHLSSHSGKLTDASKTLSWVSWVFQNSGSQSIASETLSGGRQSQNYFQNREGEGGMIWENGTETCILPYVK